MIERKTRAVRARQGRSRAINAGELRGPQILAREIRERRAFRLLALRLPAFVLPAVVLLALFLTSCSRGEEALNAELPVSYSMIDHGTWVEAIDCSYRSLALVPKGSEAPEGFPETRIIRVPIERVVVASGHYDAGIMMAMGLENEIVATDQPSDTWLLPEIKSRIDSGDITFVGLWNAMDFETIRSVKPDLVLVSNSEVGQELESFGFPVAVTYNGLDNNLENRLRLFGFLGTLLGREERGAELEKEIRGALSKCQAAAENRPRPKLSWSVFFQNRVYPLDGDFWLAEIMEICGGNYLMGYIRSGMMEVNIEEFLNKNAESEIFFASVLAEARVETKADYLHHHPELSRIKAFGPGGVVVRPELIIFQDTGRLKNIIEEVAYIIHPESNPETPRYYFHDLP